MTATERDRILRSILTDHPLTPAQREALGSAIASLARLSQHGAAPVQRQHDGGAR